MNLHAFLLLLFLLLFILILLLLFDFDIIYNVETILNDSNLIILSTNFISNVRYQINFGHFFGRIGQMAKHLN